MKRISASCLLVAGIAIAFLLAGCATPTEMLSDWAAPIAKEKIQTGGKVLAVYPIKEPGTAEMIIDQIFVAVRQKLLAAGLR